MTTEQIIELVEKWLEDPSRVTIKELDTAADYATAYAEAAYAVVWAAHWAAHWAATYAAHGAEAADAADAVWAAGRSAEYVDKYYKLTKG